MKIDIEGLKIKGKLKIKEKLENKVEVLKIKVDARKYKSGSSSHLP